MASEQRLKVVGAGLAGCEAAWQAASRGLDVVLVEMKPERYSPAHSAPEFAELVCSNSLRSNALGNAVGLLKEEMRRLGSLVVQAADETAVPAGRALAVDRQAFSRRITEAVEAHPRIEVRHEVVTRLPEDELSVLATGPLTANELAEALQCFVGDEHLYFYDALAPIAYADSIDHDVAFYASRWEDGEGDYLNLPLSEEQYADFVAALCAADTVPLHGCEAELYFEGCLPVEEMARRGPKTLAYGPMKPVGLRDPRTGQRPFAVVQLRHEDKRGVLYNMVGFQTKLRVGEQKRIFRSLPGLGEAVFARFGSVHRNTFLNAPKALLPSLELRGRPGVFIAGQMAGVEGYVESAALGWIAGVNAVARAGGRELALPPPNTAHGALLRHLIDADPSAFQPMNVNFGLFPPLADAPLKQKKREKVAQLGQRALADLAAYAEWARELTA
ncbi:MAG: methylenetetrahydrofolate--tRNA-(uracil(54)-C(5))-methyltransferase (FADH(2)-oxidizing) TrmFO [Deltaproteobacteria bacterium]|nr:methylenetetrahydrofolate--tRNA-(uracil(54)-C(5))-methyltransferase (FADH(2)-oxidizing) TrmFO [Deltaproteobacteria bacterium]MBW2360335.1 methylenetetrahydrofolate--tRNA-(uracil(54)-C(5))-methyltransferase (FADH(2)-oxidizing) TrmFO [Deltaproteobacteria bacterium]